MKSFSVQACRLHLHKIILLVCALPFTFYAFAQTESPRVIEPERKSSYDNEDLLLITLAALALLMAIYFLFRRSRGKKN
jgi:hypothetical protein